MECSLKKDEALWMILYQRTNLQPINMHYSSRRVFTQASLRQSSQNWNMFIPRVWERVESGLIKLNYCFECSTMSLWCSPTRIDGSVSELCLPFQVYQLWHICSMSVKLKLQNPRERKSCWPELLSVCSTIKNSENGVAVNHSFSILEESNLLVSETRRLAFCHLEFCKLLTFLETNKLYPSELWRSWGSHVFLALFMTQAASGLLV